MFGVVILALSIVSLASYYGVADWTWMGEQIASLVLLFMVISVALYTLMGWIKK